MKASHALRNNSHARGDTERAYEKFTTPLSAMRLARRIMREGHCGCPRLTQRSYTDAAPHREQGPPVAVHGRSNDSIASKSVQCDVRPPILFSPPGHGLVARGYSSEAIDIPRSRTLTELIDFVR